MHAREEIAKTEQGLMMEPAAAAPVLTVEVSGEVLPEVSPKDELQVSDNGAKGVCHKWALFFFFFGWSSLFDLTPRNGLLSFFIGTSFCLAAT